MLRSILLALVVLAAPALAATPGIAAPAIAATPAIALADTARAGYRPVALAPAAQTDDDVAAADSAEVESVLAYLRAEDEARRAMRPALVQPVALQQAPDSPMRSRVAALRRTLAVPAHLSFPASAAGLVDRQTEVVSGRFAGVVARGTYLFPMIEQTLARRGMPDELKYVAVIESALDPSATSYVGAAGLWQFMPETGAQYGLDAWSVRDPVRSTEAAARYLSDLAQVFDGDWQLAIASYNCGPGRVGRLTAAYRRRTGDVATFWDIRADLPRETRDYVVRFIAAARYFESHRADA